MKILYVTNGDDKYGAASSLKELIELEKNVEDVEIEVLNTKKNGLNKWCDKNEITNFSFKYYESLYSKQVKWFKYLPKYFIKIILYYFCNYIQLHRVEKVIDMGAIDIIHSNTSTIDFGAKLAKRNGIKHVWHLREFGKEDFNCYALRPKLYKWMNKNGGEFIAISKAIKNSWVKKGIDNKKIHVLYHGIPTKNIKINSNACDALPLKMVFMAAIREYKGQHQVIEAINKLSKKNRKQIHLDIYGNADSAYGTYLKMLIDKYRLEDCVSLKGFSKNKNLLSEYDIGINCSKNEGLGRFTFEYMASGLLVIASDTGANPEIINESNGIIYNYGNIESLKKAIEKCILLQKSKNSKPIITKSIKDVREKFDIEKNYIKFIKFYKKYCDEKNILINKEHKI